MSTLDSKVVEDCYKLYTETLEEFARSLGINEENAPECVLKWSIGSPETVELWHNTVLLGVITVKYVDDGISLRFVVETKKLPI